MELVNRLTNPSIRLFGCRLHSDHLRCEVGTFSKRLAARMYPMYDADSKQFVCNLKLENPFARMSQHDTVPVFHPLSITYDLPSS